MMDLRALDLIGQTTSDMKQGDDSQYNLVVPLDHILTYRPWFDRSSLDPVCGFYRSVEPNRDTP